MHVAGWRATVGATRLRGVRAADTPTEPRGAA